MSAKKKNYINLLPQEDFDKTTLGRVLKWALTTFRYIVIFVELIVVGGFLSRFYFDVQISNLNDEIKQKSSVIDARYEVLEVPFRKIQTKLSILSDVSNDNNSITPLIESLSDFIPDDSRLVSFVKNKAEVTIEIETYSENSALKFTESLRNSQYFENMAISRVESEDSSSYVKYVMKGSINYN